MPEHPLFVIVAAVVFVVAASGSLVLALAPRFRRRASLPISARSGLPLIIVRDIDEASDDLAEQCVPTLTWDPDAALDEPTNERSVFDLRAAAITDPGRLRARNEDAFLVSSADELYVVADGMGGHSGGDVASKMAIDVLASAIARAEATDTPTLPPRAAQLVAAFEEANATILDVGTHDRNLTDMGTTLVAARFCPRKGVVYIAHVGDSRCYRLRDDRLLLLTEDHTVSFNGAPTATLARAVGPRPGIKPDLAILRVRPRDLYLLCSDGLPKMLADSEIAEVLRTFDDPDLAASELVRRANERGGKDNITAVVIRTTPKLTSSGRTLTSPAKEKNNFA
jgi:protein phosphatase